MVLDDFDYFVSALAAGRFEIDLIAHALSHERLSQR
jgi:hypothetical protein